VAERESSIHREARRARRKEFFIKKHPELLRLCGEERSRELIKVSDFDIRISGFCRREETAMTKIFWVTCPQCQGEFYCHYQELRHKKIKLLCPYCSHQFLDEESPKIVE
jgi:hypothetical protein